MEWIGLRLARLVHLFDDRRGLFILDGQGGLQEFLSLGGELDVMAVGILLGRVEEGVEVQVWAGTKGVDQPVDEVRYRLFADILARQAEACTRRLAEVDP